MTGATQFRPPTFAFAFAPCTDRRAATVAMSFGGVGFPGRRGVGFLEVRWRSQFLGVRTWDCHVGLPVVRPGRGGKVNGVAEGSPMQSQVRVVSGSSD